MGTKKSAHRTLDSEAHLSEAVCRYKESRIINTVLTNGSKALRHKLKASFHPSGFYQASRVLFCL